MRGAAGGAAAGERLGWAIFVAAAAHGMLILGVGFSPPGDGGPEEVPTLEVTLLEAPVPDLPVPEDARYLAQASQDGDGNVEEQIRPEFFEHLPAPPAEEAMLRGLEVAYVVSWASPHAAVRTPEPGETEPRPEDLPPDGGITRVTAAGEREHFVSVNARESVFAEYLAAWKARVERLGTLNFPSAARLRQRQANPVLEVAIAADGSLREVRVTRSSGQGALDQAAVELVRLASPFEPFPGPVRAQFDVLRFAYEWRFIEGSAGGGILEP